MGEERKGRTAAERMLTQLPATRKIVEILALHKRSALCANRNLILST
jgi:hypothetical protein